MAIDTAALAALHNMPSAMKALPQWLVWRFLAGDPGKKPRKVPFYVSGRRRSGMQGDPADRAELVSFAEALDCLGHGLYTGLGFAFLPGDGLIGIDIDGAIDADGVVGERCQAIIDACGSFTELSPSGKGVHIIVAGESETFKDNSIGLEVFCGRQFFTCTGRRWGGTLGEVAPIDDAVLRRLKATVAKARGKADTAPVQARAAATGGAIPLAAMGLRDKLESALKHISPDMHHDEWVVIGMALKHALGDAGLALWEYWSSGGGNVASGEVMRAKWASFKGASGRGSATEATIFKLAMDAGWKVPRAPRQSRPSKPKPEAAESGLTPTSGSAGDGPPDWVDTGSEGDDEPPPDDRWRDKLLCTDSGPKDCRENVFTFLSEHPQLKGLVAFDEFSYRIVKRREPPWASPDGEWTTGDDYELGLWMAQTKGVRLTVKSEGTLAAGVAMAANRAKFHPVRDYLNATPWDGIDRLGHWLHECLGTADTPYHTLVGRWFILGMVNRVLNPGCQMDNMIVLEGAQGKMKSSALRVLAGEWFADTPIRIGDKDALLNLAGVWLYEVAELDSFNKAEVTAVKQYVSSRVDRVREPYSRRPVDRFRSCVLGGTTNQHEYFKDSTGSRRFWPFSCDGDIDLAKLKAWRDQLFAEAMHALQSGERYHPSKDETERYILPEQESREITDPWYERIALWVDSEGEELTKSYTSSQILTGALHVPADRIDGARQMATRVGIVMRKLGWAKVRDATGARLWRYLRPLAGHQGASLAQPVPGVGAAWGADAWEGGGNAH
jgi:predicted P-loop ATPase